jgi:mRNA deadenylase 3'-5' endonuclease subunit Ccr4
LDPTLWENYLKNQVDPNFISITSFNTLRKNYAFHNKYWVPDDLRLWSTRLAIHQELMASLHTDIVCVQEAEIVSFEEDFVFMEYLGYTSVKPQAKNSKKIEDSTIHGHTKPSIFFKTDRLLLKWHNPRSRIVLALFEVIETGRLFYVINCHLQGGIKEESQRLCQLRSAFKELKKHMESFKITKEQLTVILCGDFNATPNHSIHAILQKGSLSSEDKTKFFQDDPKAEKAVFTHDFTLCDSYSVLSDEERPYTFKWGVKDDALFNILDFIYYSKGTLTVQALRNPLLDSERILMKDKLGIPNSSNPSDHLPVATLLKFK